MRIDVRRFLPPGEEALRRLSMALDAPAGAQAGEERFARLMTAVRQAHRLEQLRSGAKEAASLGALADAISHATGVSRDRICRGLPGGAVAWGAVLAGKRDPLRLAAAAYAALGRRFALPFAVLADAVSGSYRLFQQHAAQAHPHFAAASRRSRRQQGFSAQLGAAFAELHTKSAVVRAASGGDARLKAFLAEVQRCST